MRRWLRRRRTGAIWSASGACSLVLAIATACGCGDGTWRTASVYLKCAAVARNLHCQLIALSNDVSRPARDVTTDANWQVSPTTRARLAGPGLVEPLDAGDVDIDVRYASKTAHAAARFTPNEGPELLGSLHGQAFSQTDNGRTPISGVRITVMNDDTDNDVMTDKNGIYELAKLAPGDVMLHAVKSGFFPADVAARVWAGDTNVSFIMQSITPTSTVDVVARLRAPWNSAPVD